MADKGRQHGIYRRYIKRALDKALSALGIVLLSPLWLAIVVAIKLDSKGPILFRQKRVGLNKRHFMILKFRSMKMSTPHDMPTHLLENPEQYITRVGKVLRKTSLDELPQIWNIFKGDMSIIGPRPALWKPMHMQPIGYEHVQYGIKHHDYLLQMSLKNRDQRAKAA